MVEKGIFGGIRRNFEGQLAKLERKRVQSAQEKDGIWLEFIHKTQSEIV